MEEEKIYRVYSNYLKDRYGQKVYRIPINLPLTCPNRDIERGKGGCSFCGANAAGFEALSEQMPVKMQIEQNIAYIAPKYKAKKFIAYFQNFTNTYLSPEKFQQYIEEAVCEGVVEIAVSTRPDCVHERYLDILKAVQERNSIDITIELGLQSINHKTLKKINRGHSLAEFIDAVRIIQSYHFAVTVHMILDLPYDDEEDIIEGAKILSALKVDAVKLHSLYILKNTPMAIEYQEGWIQMGSVECYIDHVITFLEYLSPDITIQRLVGRAPKEETIFCNYGFSWWKIKDQILDKMIQKKSYQGINYNYLNGKAIRGFL